MQKGPTSYTNAPTGMQRGPPPSSAYFVDTKKGEVNELKA